VIRGHPSIVWSAVDDLPTRFFSVSCGFLPNARLPERSM